MQVPRSEARSDAFLLKVFLRSPPIVDALMARRRTRAPSAFPIDQNQKQVLLHAQSKERFGQNANNRTSHSASYIGLLHIRLRVVMHEFDPQEDSKQHRRVLSSS